MTKIINEKKSYSELMKLKTFDERYDYLKIGDKVGEDTFGYDRYLNQALYTSPEWRKVRNEIIIRDNGCDLACEDRNIGSMILIHHLNPITKQNILDRSPELFDPENLICVSKKTHDAIHFGSKEVCHQDPIERKPGDTKIW